MLLASLLAALLLALVHVATPSLRFLEGTPRSVWLSLAGGLSVACVFVHFLRGVSRLGAAKATHATAAGRTCWVCRGTRRRQGIPPRNHWREQPWQASATSPCRPCWR